jgi:L-phenylalanine/L-methionine N-acetyltransferase
MDITIRREEPGDFEEVYEIFTCPKVIWETLQLPYPSREAWRRRMAEPEDGRYSLVALVDGRIVGRLGLSTEMGRPRRKHVGGIGMAVRDDFQGQGIGTALMRAAVDMADNWLNLLRLELTVFTDNEPAVRLYKKCGFEIEGTLRCHSFRAGQYLDVYYMARLRPEELVHSAEKNIIT